MAFVQLQVTIGGSATQFTTTRTPIKAIRVEPNTGNTNPAFVGDKNVSTTVYAARLSITASKPDQAFSIVGAGDGNCMDLNEFWVAGTNGEKVNVSYLTV